jgi:hypothetical protein
MYVISMRGLHWKRPLYCVNTWDKAKNEKCWLKESLKDIKNIYNQFEFVQKDELEYIKKQSVRTWEDSSDAYHTWNFFTFDEETRLEYYELFIKSQFIKSIVLYHLELDPIILDFITPETINTINGFTVDKISYKNNGWVDIFEEKPKEGQKVLTYFDVFDKIEIAEYSIEKIGHDDEVLTLDCFSNDRGFLCDDIYHWMHLPEKPKGYTNDY